MELGCSPRERPSPGPEAARKATGVTGEAATEDMADETMGDPAFTADVVEVGLPPFIVMSMAIKVFMEAVDVVEVILGGVRSR